MRESYINILCFYGCALDCLFDYLFCLTNEAGAGFFVAQVVYIACLTYRGLMHDYIYQHVHSHMAKYERRWTFSLMQYCLHGVVTTNKLESLCNIVMLSWLLYRILAAQ